MNALPALIAGAFDLALVLAGFTLIILIHELGHFLAARWAGIRVLAFAIGFGPAVASFRPGLGLRRGSSEAEYLRRLKAGDPAAAAASPTEYRWNVLPLGGYVRMLGQDDADPAARSAEPDGYQNCPPWKRMVVISAGVVFNAVSAALLFIIVFSVGLRTEPPRIGLVAPGSPAASAIAVTSGPGPVSTTPPRGLRPGDTILSINGQRPDAFNDLTLASAMAPRNRALTITVQRPGVDAPLTFAVTPAVDEQSRLLQIGVGPALTGTLRGRALAGEARDRMTAQLARLGLPGVEPGMALLSVNAGPPPEAPAAPATPAAPAGAAPSYHDLVEACRLSEGRPVPVVFGDSASRRVEAMLRPRAELLTATFAVAASGRGARSAFDSPHLLGLAPVMRVATVGPAGEASGLRDGDVFVRLGDLEWPTLAEGMVEIRRGKRTSIPVVVERARSGGDGVQRVDLGDVPVRDGIIGFAPDTTDAHSTRLARWPALALTDLDAARLLADASALPAVPPPAGPAAADSAAAPDAPPAPSGARLGLLPGSVITAVAGRPVSDFTQLREALRQAAAASPNADGSATVRLSVRPPQPPPLAESAQPADAAQPLDVIWTLAPAEARALATLGWTAPLGPGDFELEQTLLRGDGPAQSITLGIQETHRVMVMTYLTFARLFQGTVKVEHLRGPVGIVHTGTILSERGFVWLLFFLALVSVNLAVINFLPLPIVDGGHMVFLLYEQLTGRPVSGAVQNAATAVGLVMIGTMFLVVTYNDLANLLWR